MVVCLLKLNYGLQVLSVSVADFERDHYRAGTTPRYPYNSRKLSERVSVDSLHWKRPHVVRVVNHSELEKVKNLYFFLRVWRQSAQVLFRWLLLFWGVVQYVMSILGVMVERSAAAVNSKFSSMYGLLVSYKTGRFAPSPFRPRSFRPNSKSFRPNLKSFRPNLKVVSFSVNCDVFRNFLRNKMLPLQNEVVGDI